MAVTLLSNSLSKTGQALIESIDHNDDKALEYFIGLVKQLHKDRPFIEESERGLAYLLELFAKSVHNNLFLDTPYSEMLQDRRQHLLRGMGQYLVNMATAMENANNTDFRTNLNKMVYEFLETVDQLNQDFESGLWAKRKEDS
jgi:hypothetical protein